MTTATSSTKEEKKRKKGEKGDEGDEPKGSTHTSTDVSSKADSEKRKVGGRCCEMLTGRLWT